MSTRQKSGNDRSRSEVVKVIVAVKVSKEISRTALTWALTNVVREGDCIRLLVVIPSHSSSKKLWSFSNFHSDCIAGHWRFMLGTVLEQKQHITKLCNEMMCQLLDIYDPDKVTVKVKVIYGPKDGVVASEAKKVQTQWVILDKGMKKEAHFCMEQLDCNVIVVKNSEPKVLRFNLMEPKRTETKILTHSKSSRKHAKDDFDLLEAIKVPNVTPTSSPDRVFSISSLEMFTSPKFVSEIDWEPKVMQILQPSYGDNYFDESESESDSDNVSTFSATVSYQHWMEDNLTPDNNCSKLFNEGLQSRGTTPMFENYQFSELCSEGTNQHHHKSVRKMVSMNKNLPANPPPLCSICQLRTPSFGEPPRSFSYTELVQATNGFSQPNFLAEGGYGSVYRGVLRDGLAIAVKQHKLASSQGDHEFCSEVHVLSCAQHRNVIMLIGYCVEERRRLLVYEYICNGSLDSHLYGHNQNPLNWVARQKIAVGAARGLRYLHEECRVGSIVHRDMRPNNILLTHDFEPLVGDFGLARFQPDGESGVETRIIGTFGYIAPEYAQTGQVSEKADVYSFGVILVELVTGRKAVDMNRPRGEQCLTEWIRPRLEDNVVSKLVDPCLMNCFSEKEVLNMLHCASLCLQHNPLSRPRMSQVLRILEGDT